MTLPSGNLVAINNDAEYEIIICLFSILRSAIDMADRQHKIYLVFMSK